MEPNNVTISEAGKDALRFDRLREAICTLNEPFLTIISNGVDKTKKEDFQAAPVELRRKLVNDLIDAAIRETS